GALVRQPSVGHEDVAVGVDLDAEVRPVASLDLGARQFAHRVELEVVLVESLDAVAEPLGDAEESLLPVTGHTTIVPDSCDTTARRISLVRERRQTGTPCE